MAGQEHKLAELPLEMSWEAWGWERASLAMGMEVGWLSFTSPQAPGCPHLAQGPKVTPALSVLDSKGSLLIDQNPASLHFR